MTFLRTIEEGFAKGDRLRPLDLAYLSLGTSGLLDKSGSVLSSSEATLSPGLTYFIGLNPGGDGDQDGLSGSDYPTISESLALSRLGCNAFDQDWSSKKYNRAPGEAPMQKGFKAICTELGICYSTVCATNFVFTRSRNIEEHGQFGADLKASLEVHRHLLAAVKPQFLWIHGNPATVGLEVEMEWTPSGYSNWSIGRGQATLCGRQYPAVHTPHLSFWDPMANRDALAWAFEFVGPLSRGTVS